MRKFLFGLALGLAASAAAASAAFPAQLPSAFASGQLLLASSLEDLRQAVNGMLGAFDASGNVAASKVATGSAARFVTDAQVSSWDSKLSSASGSLFATLSGGTVPLVQLPPVFDTSGLNVLASAVSTSAGARFATDAQIAGWNNKLDMATAAVSFAPLSGGTIPAQYLPSSTGSFAVATQAEAEAGTENTKGMTALGVSQFFAANRATDEQVMSGSSSTQYVTADQLNRYGVGITGIGESYEYLIKTLGSASFSEEAYTKKIEYLVRKGGTYRIRFQLRGTGGQDYAYPTAMIYKNGSPYGVEHRTWGYDCSATFDEVLAFAAGDYLQIYVKEGNWRSYVGYIDNVRVLTDYTPPEIRALRSEF